MHQVGSAKRRQVVAGTFQTWIADDLRNLWTKAIVSVVVKANFTTDVFLSESKMQIQRQWITPK